AGTRHHRRHGLVARRADLGVRRRHAPRRVRHRRRDVAVDVVEQRLDRRRREQDAGGADAPRARLRRQRRLAAGRRRQRHRAARRRVPRARLRRGAELPPRGADRRAAQRSLLGAAPAGCARIPLRSAHALIRADRAPHFGGAMSPRILAAALAAALASPAFAVTPAPSESARFRELVDHYYDEYPRFHPSAATELGLHQHDAELESLSAESRRALAAWLHDYARRVAALDAARLTPAEQIDLATLKAGLDSSLVELEDVQGWQHRPDAYTGLASRSIYSIIKRDFAPADERLRSVIAREEKIPALLAEGKKNLSGVS